MRRRLMVVAGCVAVAIAGTVAVVLATGGSGHQSPVRRAPASAARHRVNTALPLHRAPQARKPIIALSTSPGGESRCLKPPAPAPEQPIDRPEWLSGVTITEYYPALESWFAGRRVRAPGLPGTYAVDWLYSARGLAMEGDGVDRDGHRVHIADLGSTGWVNLAGKPTGPVCLGKWTNGSPDWLIGGWRNARGQVTFPLQAGGWSNGPGRAQLLYGGVTFAPAPSLPLRYYHSIAVDPGLIPLGSRVYVPAYRHLGGGWFVAQDTGGAIKGRHIDVYRPPPPTPKDLGRFMTGQRILVIPPPAVR